MVLQEGNETLATRLMIPAISASIAEVVTIPVDTAKVRMMIAQGAMKEKYATLMKTINAIAKEEGVMALYGGLSPGIHRQIVFCGLRVGMYDYVRDFYSNILYGQNQTGKMYPARILSGMTTGTIAMLIAQPTDVVKVRMQAQARGGGVKRYKNTLDAYTTILREEGRAGLYAGLVPNVVRNCVVNVAEVVCYDVTKEFLLSTPYFDDNPICHFAAANITALNVMCVTCPIEVIRNRLMNTTTNVGIVQAFTETLRKDGFFSFYKGGFPYFLRIVTWNLCMWMTFEQLKKFKHQYLDGKND